jgi:primosomal protein N' (replication factor Y)
MDTDTTSGKQGHQKILEAFMNHEADILVGTQMIVKGHDFPLVTLMGVLAADMSLFVNDYRASERTFQLLMQAAGRAGRGEEAGDVVIQTYQPEHYAVKTAAEHDYESFYRLEVEYRKLLQYPPISDIMAILAVSEKEASVEQMMGELNRIAVRRARIVTEKKDEVKIIGPTVASVAKIKDQYRRILYLKGKHDTLVKFKDEMEVWIQGNKGRADCFVYFDFNPIHGY